MTHEHPCGNLPVYGLSIAAWNCPHHQTTWWNAYTYVESGRETIQTTWTYQDECGPLISDHELIMKTMARGLKHWDNLMLPPLHS